MKTKEKKTKAQKDLEWFFWEAESSMGLKSNYQAFIQACKYSTNHQDEFDRKLFAEIIKSQISYTSIFAATDKERSILQAYHKLSGRHKKILESYYEERQFDSKLADSFGEGIGLIPLTEMGKKMHQNILKWPSEKFAIEFLRNKAKIKEQVTQLYNEALTAFEKARKEK